jgi:hypothetical protein
MGFRDLFRKNGVQLGVETDKEAYLPGETVTATITVVGKDDLEIQEGRAELVYENEYTYRDRNYDSDGRYTTDSRTTTDHVTHATEPFLPAGTVRSGAGDAYAVALRIPEEVAPSGEGEITKVRWKVKAILSRRRARDPGAEAPFTVLSPPEAHAEWIAREPELDTDADCELELRLTGGRHVRPGDTVAGALVVTPRSELDANEVRLELVRHESVPRDEGNETETVEASTVAGESPELTTAVPHEYPFEFTIPAGSCPSLATEESEVRWFLRGVVARRMRSDYNVKQELNVYTAAAPAPAALSVDRPQADALDAFKRPPGGG